jgi:hypothetical protein
MKRMRKLLIVLAVVLVAMSILWLVGERLLSRFVDQFATRTMDSKPIQSISYEGNGDGGRLIIDGDRSAVAGGLSPSIHVGSTKDNQLGLAYGGKVFAFGPLASPDVLLATVGNGDVARVTTRQSFVGWTRSCSDCPIRRNSYTDLDWTKPSGAKLHLTWMFVPIGFDEGSIDLIRVEISDAPR